MKVQAATLRDIFKKYASRAVFNVSNLLSYAGRLQGQSLEKSPAEATVPNHILNSIVEYWRSGQWETVVHRVTPYLSQYPDSSTLALLRASAHQQLGHTQEAKLDYQLAVATGCSPETAKRVMLAGALATVAAATDILGDQERTSMHSREAARILGIADNQQLQNLGQSMHQDASLINRT